jgi:glyoxylase-like metal-dependent hydrolase (beta-lactamase superfamily II)
LTENRVPISVWQIKYGERVVRRSYAFKDYAQYGLPDGDLEVDYNFWVLRAGETTILVDTGYDISARDWLGETSVTPPIAGLGLIDVDPATVDMVVTSHFHYDHIGELHRFTNAQIVSGQAEYDYWFAKLAAGTLDGEFTTAENLEPVRKARDEGRLRLVSAETEVFPGVTVYPVGGHCPGQLIIHVETDGGGLILAVDAAHFYEQFENGWPFAAFTDLREMKEGFAFINRLAARTGAAVIPGHDARVRDRYPAAPGRAGQVATVLA